MRTRRIQLIRQRCGHFTVWSALWLGFLLGVQPGQAQMVDLNGDGMSDVWQAVYGAFGLAPNADADGDHFSNRMEALAGTNPFDPTSYPFLPSCVVSNGSALVSLPCALGKQYQLQSTTNLQASLATNWVMEATLVARTGTVVTLVASANVAAKFFRVAISDVDSDGDGVNDWEEYQLGLNPFDAHSNGHFDAQGNRLTDYQYLTNASFNQVTLRASGPPLTQPKAGQPAATTGTFTLARSGLPLQAITVNLAPASPGPGLGTEGVDFAALPRSVILPAGVSSQAISLVPLANTNLMSPVLATLIVQAPAGGTLSPPTNYTAGFPSNASILIYPSPTPSGSGLTGQYFSGASATYSDSANFNPTNLALTRLDPSVDFVWGTPSTPIVNTGAYTVRWTGQVQPEFSETYTFYANTSDGVRLWVNGQRLIDNWSLQPAAADSSGSITLIGGARYSLQMDYFNLGDAATAHLSWSSPSQPRQVLPGTRLYPSTATGAAPVITSGLTAVAFVGQPFAYTVTALNSPTKFTINSLPPGLTFNATNGLLSGTPTVLGDYPLTLTASNAVGVAASVLDLQVVDPNAALTNQVTRELWTSLPGTNVSDIPVATTPALLGSLTRLEGITGYGVNYGERIRAYLTPPVSGNYRFWIAGSDAAELWLSDDSEAVSKLRRAYVTPTPGTNAPAVNGTLPRQWNVQPTQQSPWLALQAGQKYYLEVLHKAGTGTNDNWAVGWLLDPTGTNTTPSGVVPGSALSPYFAPPLTVTPGTLYAANLLAQVSVPSTAVGTATLRLSADQSQAILNFAYSGLSSAVTGRHIHSDPYLNNPSTILFDIDTATAQPDGSYVWTIAPVGTLAVADIVEILQEGKAFLNVHTANYPGGEINGHFTLANGAQAFTAPPAPPAWTDDHTTPNAAARFLIQATYGANSNDIASVQNLGYAGWLNQQFGLPASHHLPYVQAHLYADIGTPYVGTLTDYAWWQQSITAPDQLRQRVAFALSEILVVSDRGGGLVDEADAVSAYYDVLLDHAFDNFRTVLETASLSPAMGLYLNMLGNDKANASLGTHPNENYARELMQLFSLGLNRLWPDGTLMLNSKGNLVPTYDQSVVSGLASALTGWNYAQPNQANGRLPVNWFPARNYTNAMVLVPTHHETAAKLLLDHVMLPAAQGSQADPSNPAYDAFGTQELKAALDNIFNHPNIGPFICRQLIQRLVTSNPSRDYIYRVTQKFNDNGYGVRGDLQAVLKAILLDYEARSSSLAGQSTYGKQREPVLRITAPARAFLAPQVFSGTYSQAGSQVVSITTSTPHKLATGNMVWLTFNDTSGQPAPASALYPLTVSSPNSFTVNALGLVAGTYAQSNGLMTVTAPGHGLLTLTNPGPVFLQSISGGLPSGLYSVLAVSNSSVFTVATTNSGTLTGNCLLPSFSIGYSMTTAGGLSTFSCFTQNGFPHGFHVNDTFNLHSGLDRSSATLKVVSVGDAQHFVAQASGVNLASGQLAPVFPLVPPPLVRSGTVSIPLNTWLFGRTDAALGQTPLSAESVFNFFSPDYKFPGLLASAGLTTPEFQLTTDTTVVNHMNFLGAGILGDWVNTNTLVHIQGAADLMDMGPWLTTNYTATASGLGNLVDGLNTLLCAGQLSTGTKTQIVNCVSDPVSFPYDSPPTLSQMRRRLTMVLYLILTSPDFIIQK